MIKDELLRLYQEALSEPGLSNLCKVELRVFLNKHFKANINPRVSAMAASAQQGAFQVWGGGGISPTAKKKLNFSPAADKQGGVVHAEAVPKEPEPATELEELRQQVVALGGKPHPKATADTLRKLIERLKD